MRWESEALLRLGAAEYARQEAELAAQQARQKVDDCGRSARAASLQCANVLQALGAILGLPPGEWTYDKATGTLVSKEDHA